MTARQGHRYTYFGLSVLAMESGERVRVREILPDWPWLGPEMHALAQWLKPEPMKYTQGEVPA